MTLAFDAAIAAFQPELPLAVAYSGGADSTALLHACAERWSGQVRAIHVHHGLQAAGDAFETHCRRVCETLRVPLKVCHVDARPAPGDSPEAAARDARYRMLADAVRRPWPVEPAFDAASAAAIRPIATVALAQHADDQIETLLLALSRGAGLPGLASMPARWERDGVRYERPLLRVARPDIEAWVRARSIAWIDDPSNADARYTRNRIRHQVLPALAAVTPQWRDTLARSASHAAQAQGLLAELAAEDLQRIGLPPSVKGLRALSRARQANALRAWLQGQPGATPSAVQLDELLDQIAACATRGQRLRIRVGRGTLWRALDEGDVLRWKGPVGDAT